MNAFHVCGALLAGWALLVSFLGITREGFPASVRSARLVGAISVVLVALAIGSAVYTGIHDKKDQPEGQDTGALLPL